MSFSLGREMHIKLMWSFLWGFNPFSVFGVTDEKLKELHPDIDSD
jgi:hypothetical protein